MLHSIFRSFIILHLMKWQDSYGVVFDCVDIYRQPAFDHPLLKNHKLQVIVRIKNLYSLMCTYFLRFSIAISLAVVEICNRRLLHQRDLQNKKLHNGNLHQKWDHGVKCTLEKIENRSMSISKIYFSSNCSVITVWF